MLLEVERLASELIELATRHSFAHWLAIGEVFRGWTRSASGNTAEGLPLIEEGIGGLPRNRIDVWVPYFLALKAEALRLAGRTSEALQAITEAEHWSKDLKRAAGLPSCLRLRGVVLTEAGCRRGPDRGCVLRSHQDRKGAEVDFLDQARGSNLRGIPSPKSKWSRPRCNPTTSVQLISLLALRPIPVCCACRFLNVAALERGFWLALRAKKARTNLHLVECVGAMPWSRRNRHVLF